MRAGYTALKNSQLALWPDNYPRIMIGLSILGIEEKHVMLSDIGFALVRRIIRS